MFHTGYILHPSILKPRNYLFFKHYIYHLEEPLRFHPYPQHLISLSPSSAPVGEPAQEHGASRTQCSVLLVNTEAVEEKAVLPRLVMSLPGTADARRCVISYHTLQVCHSALTRSHLLFSFTVAATPRPRLPWLSSAEVSEVGFCWTAASCLGRRTPRPHVITGRHILPEVIHPLRQLHRKAHL